MWFRRFCVVIALETSYLMPAGFYDSKLHWSALIRSFNVNIFLGFWGSKLSIILYGFKGDLFYWWIIYPSIHEFSHLCDVALCSCTSWQHKWIFQNMIFSWTSCITFDTSSAFHLAHRNCLASLTKLSLNALKMKFSIKDFFSKCDEIRRTLRIWSHLRKKSLMKSFIFCAVSVAQYIHFGR